MMLMALRVQAVVLFQQLLPDALSGTRVHASNTGQFRRLTHLPSVWPTQLVRSPDHHNIPEHKVKSQF